MPSPLSAERAARNESVFRNANERLEQRLDELSLLDGRSPFLCECEDAGCAEALWLTPAEYEAVRAEPRRFIVAFGHPVTASRLIDHRDGFDVVEKEGRTGEIAADLDPRS